MDNGGTQIGLIPSIVTRGSEMPEYCEHNQTVQVFASVFKCSVCGELTDSKDEELRPDVAHYKRARRSQAIAKRRAIRRNAHEGPGR